MALYQILTPESYREILGWPWAESFGNSRIYFTKTHESDRINCIGDFPKDVYVFHAETQMDTKSYFSNILSRFAQGNLTDPSIWSHSVPKHLPDPLQNLSSSSQNSNMTFRNAPSHLITPDGLALVNVSNGTQLDTVFRRCTYTSDCPHGQFCVNFEDFRPSTPNFCFKAGYPSSLI